MRITDRREIEFDPKSIVSVVASSPKASQSFGLPGMPPVGVQFHPKSGTVDVLYGTPNALRSVTISAEALGALIISYCIRARIPMPRKADKGIRIESAVVVLAFRTKYDETPAAVMVETPTRAATSVTAWTWVNPERAKEDPEN